MQMIESSECKNFPLSEEGTATILRMPWFRDRIPGLNGERGYQQFDDTEETEYQEICSKYKTDSIISFDK